VHTTGIRAGRHSCRHPKTVGPYPNGDRLASLLAALLGTVEAWYRHDRARRNTARTCCAHMLQ